MTLNGDATTVMNIEVGKANSSWCCANSGYVKVLNGRQ